jgi:hypothetical protein
MIHAGDWLVKLLVVAGLVSVWQQPGGPHPIGRSVDLSEMIPGVRGPLSPQEEAAWRVGSRGQL